MLAETQGHWRPPRALFILWPCSLCSRQAAPFLHTRHTYPAPLQVSFLHWVLFPQTTARTIPSILVGPDTNGSSATHPSYWAPYLTLKCQPPIPSLPYTLSLLKFLFSIYHWCCAGKSALLVPKQNKTKQPWFVALVFPSVNTLPQQTSDLFISPVTVTSLITKLGEIHTFTSAEPGPQLQLCLSPSDTVHILLNSFRVCGTDRSFCLFCPLLDPLCLQYGLCETGIW